jgi:plastocyanin
MPSSIRRVLFVIVTLSLLLPLAGVRAQAGAHLVLVKLVDKPNAQFAFEPAAIVAQRGDTVRFVQASAAPHNVHFLKMPKGAKLGDAAVGPYIIGAGKTYDLAIDSRFVDGTYQFTCDPHETVGMHGTLTIGPSTK